MAQGCLQYSEDPTARFLSLIGAAIASGNAYVASEAGNVPSSAARWGWRVRNGNAFDSWEPQGRLVGWVDGENLYLEPESAYAVVQQMARQQQGTLPTTQRTLWKRLAERGLLTT
jgi:hypothetical protein